MIELIELLLMEVDLIVPSLVEGRYLGCIIYICYRPWML